MGGENSSSFIPKRNPIRRSRQRVSRHVYLFTIFSYASLFAALIASGALFLYGRYNDGLLAEAVSALDTEIGSFSEDNMDEVITFNNRLSQASYRFNHSVSVRSLLEEIERSTVTTAQLTSFNVSRVEDESYEVQTSILTDSFDSTMFQRGVLERNPQIASLEIENVTSGAAENASAEGESTSRTLANASDEQETVTFNASLSFALDTIPMEIGPRTTPMNIFNDDEISESDILSEEPSDSVLFDADAAVDDGVEDVIDSEL